MRKGADLTMFAEGLRDLLNGKDSDVAEAAAMTIGEALAVYIGSNTK